MEFNSIRYDILETLLIKYPEEGRLQYLLALEEAAAGDNKLAKERLSEAAKLSDGSMKSEILDLMCHLFSGKSFIPIQPTDRGKDIFFELDRFYLNEDIVVGENNGFSDNQFDSELDSQDSNYSADSNTIKRYTQEDLCMIDQFAEEFDKEIEEPDFQLDMPSDVIFPYGLRLVRNNEFCE